MFGKLFSRSPNPVVKPIKKTSITAVKTVVLKTKTGQLIHASPVGVVDNFYDKISVMTLKLKGVLRLGDLIFIKGRSTKYFQKVGSMQHFHKPITKAQNGDDIGIKVRSAVAVGDTIFRCLVKT